MDVSTIAAIATPPGHGGIGIIKISGPDSIPAALSVFRPKGSLSASHASAEPRPDDFSPEPRHLYYGNVIDSDSNRIIDEALLVVMRAPASYTAEDVVEIQSHAGPVVLKSILRSLIKKGIQLAEPGEFTRRAFLNGRIDLTQAEAVIDVIAARSEKSLDIAMAQISGDLNSVIQSLRSTLLDILSFVEAAIDFPDDVEEIDVNFLLKQLDEDVIEKVRSLITRSEEQSFLREGLKIVIAGGPNAGKSSLMNRLVEKERSIVTSIPGTTRDLVEDSFVLSGLPIVLTDTAGIHDKPDPVEQIGIEKAWEHISNADIILFTVDAGKHLTPENRNLFNQLQRKKVIIVINKIDLPTDEVRFEIPAEWMTTPNIPVIRVSALYNLGITDLKSLIVDTATAADFCVEDTVVPNLRHKLLLESALLSLNAARDGLIRSAPFELISIDLKTSMDALAEITGDTIKPDILDNIFSRFCIGK